METEQIALSVEDRISIVETTSRDVCDDLWTKNQRLKKELEELSKRLQNVKQELTAALNDLKKRLDEHERVGDFCPHTGK